LPKIRRRPLRAEVGQRQVQWLALISFCYVG
jgi:hypothetical protein